MWVTGTDTLLRGSEMIPHSTRLLTNIDSRERNAKPGEKRGQSIHSEMKCARTCVGSVGAAERARSHLGELDGLERAESTSEIINTLDSVSI